MPAKPTNPRALLAAVLLLAAGAPTAPRAQDAPKIEAEKLAEGIWALYGRGGNLAVSIGKDGTFLVDDQFAPLTPAILAKIAELGGDVPRFVVNTHFHGDHTGGNENLKGKGAIVVAHEKARELMTVESFTQVFGQREPAPAGNLPVVTFNDAVTFHFNGEIRVFHVGPAHTAGDAVVHFRDANVIHAGDLFFSGLYPFIDDGGGGDPDGVVAAVDAILAMADEDTRILPGHGPAGGRAALQAYRDMLATIVGRVRKGIEAGRSLEEITASKPTAEWDAEWGGGFLPPEKFVALLHTLLTAR